jgi:apolipoprotein N-acyltransferase
VKRGELGLAVRVAATWLLWTAAISGPPWSWAGWSCLAPGYFDVWSARDRRSAVVRAILHGLAAGSAYGRGALSFGALAEMDLSMRLAIFVITTLVGAAVFGASAAAGRALGGRRSFRGALAGAAGWCVAEYALSLPFSGIGISLASTQWAFPQVVQLASLTGAYGVGFMVALVNGSAAESFVRKELRPASLGLAALAGATIFGAVRLHRPQPAPGPVVALLQGGYVPAQGADEEKRRAAVRAAYLPLAESAGRTASLLVWPETTVPVLSGDDSNPEFPLGREAAGLTGKPQIFGASLPVAGAPDRRWNVGIWMDPEGVVRGVYHRGLPIPFGEFLPWPLNHVFKRPVVGTVEAAKGGPELFSTPLGTAAVTMCGEAFLDSYSSEQARRGANLFINLSDGLWFAGTPNVNVTFAMNVFRAAETGRPLLRTDNLGPSAVIDGRGKVLAYLEHRKVGVVSSPLPPLPEEPTLYLRWGDAFVGLCAAGLLLSLLLLRPA